MANKTIDDQIQERINAFVGELSGLVKAAALEAVSQALGGELAASATVGRKRGRPPGKATAARKAKPGKRMRRTAAHLEEDKQALVDYVTANPGQRLEEISAGMGIDSKHLKRPALLLLGERTLRKEGERRGTRYFPGGKGKSAKKAGSRKRKKKATRKKR